MRVKDLKEVLNQVDDNLDIFAFDQKVESWGIFNEKSEQDIVTRFKLSNFNKDNIITKNKMEKSILVVEVNHLPSEYKDKSLEEVKELLETEYGHKVFLIDNSRSNTQGSQSFNTTPVYIIG